MYTVCILNAVCNVHDSFFIVAKFEATKFCKIMNVCIFKLVFAAILTPISCFVTTPALDTT